MLPGDISLSVIRIPPGEFTHGGGHHETSFVPPAARVTLTKLFHIGRTEVTQAQFQALMDTNPSTRRDLDLPVENVSWAEAAAFCKRLSALTGRSFRLPTEAEWEHACRGGTGTPLFYIRESRTLYAWTRANSNGRTHPVAGLRANPFGLFDTYGNVAEWTADWQTFDHDPGPLTDPAGPAEGDVRLIRGGSSLSGSPRSGSRSIARPGERRPDLGFRAAMDDR